MEKLNDFIQYGGQWDEETRKAIVDHLLHQLNPASYPKPQHAKGYLDTAQETLTPFFKDGKLKKQVSNNPDLVLEVAEQVIDWLEKNRVKAQISVDEKFEAHREALERIKGMEAGKFQQSYSSLEKDLKKSFSEQEINFSYYGKQFEDLQKEREANKGETASANADASKKAGSKSTPVTSSKSYPKPKQSEAKDSSAKPAPKLDSKTNALLQKAWLVLKQIDQFGIISIERLRTLGKRRLGKLGVPEELVDLLLDEYEKRKKESKSTRHPPSFIQDNSTSKDSPQPGSFSKKSSNKNDPKRQSSKSEKSTERTSKNTKQQTKGPQPPPKRISPADLQRNFIKDWEAALEARQLKARLDAIDKARKEFLKKLYAEIEEYLKLQELLGPFTGYLGRGFDLSQGNWQQSGFDLLKRYAALLENDATIKELADLLGRMRSAEVELEEEEYESITIETKWEVDHAYQEEIVGVRESNDLNYMLPIEAALLADPETEIRFFQKFAESRLQTYQLQGKTATEEKISETKTRQKEKEQNKGPFIICVDTSGSMHGTPEQVAKVLAFALTKLAIQENRKAYLISFSTSIQTQELTDLHRSLDDLIAFLQMSFHGGTDASPALQESLRKLDSEGWEKSDVIMVSDFVMSAPPTKIRKQMAAAKKKETRFFALTVSSSGNNQAIAEFDHCWVYDPRDKEALKRTLRGMKEKLFH